MSFATAFFGYITMVILTFVGGLVWTAWTLREEDNPYWGDFKDNILPIALFWWLALIISVIASVCWLGSKGMTKALNAMHAWFRRPRQPKPAPKAGLTVAKA